MDVSVVIPAYNREALVGDAIDSCLAQRGETVDVEVIVVNDGSTDSTAVALDAYGDRIRVLTLDSNCGRNRARNEGLAAARGAYVKFLDSDDVLLPATLPVEVRAAREFGADIVISGWADADLRGASGVTRRSDAPEFGNIVDGVLAGLAVPTGAALYSRALVRDLRWDEEMRVLDDWDWFVRAALRASRIHTLPIVSYCWRQHAGQGIRSDTRLANAVAHHRILEKIEQWLEEAGQMTSARRRRLAQYYYKELRVLCVYDRPRFERAAEHIQELDPAFVPREEERQGAMRVLGRVIGFRHSTLLHTRLKLAVSKLVQTTRSAG